MLKIEKLFKLNKLSLHGRNNQGRITLYHKGGRVKQSYYRLDFNKYIWYIFGLIIEEIYNCNRRNFMFLILYSNGILCYIPSIKHLFIGALFFNGNNRSIRLKKGTTLLFYKFPMGIYINLLLLNKEFYSKYIRSPGSYGRVIKRVGIYFIVKLRSKFYFQVMWYSQATIGILKAKKCLMFNKAGTLRYLGKRPSVRGVAMNPVDHPHGGGQGKTSGGRPSVSRWGWYTKGQKTCDLKWRRFSKKTLSFK